MSLTFDETIQKHKLDDLRKDEEENLMKVMSDKYGLPYIDLRGIGPEPDALRYIKEEDARTAEIAPFKLVGHKLYVATTSPNNPKMEELLRPIETRGTELLLFLCSHQSLEHVWSRYADINETKQVESGALELTEKKMTDLMAQFNRVEELKSIFEDLEKKNVLYKTTKLIELIIAGAIKFDASDIHIEPEEDKIRLRYRLNGVLEDVMFFPTTDLKQIVNRLKLLSGLKLSNNSSAQDGRFSINLHDVSIEVRVSIMPSNYGESFVMRLLDPRHSVSHLENIAVGPKIRELIERALSRPNGVILTTGPTGSGKTTTLYAFLNKVYTPEVKIITIENPIEYHLEGITQTQTDEEKGYTFLSGLRSALRQDPDIIMIGEIRDEDTAKVAINAALTGHLVLSTLHTNNAAGTIPRLIDLKVNPKVISSALSLAIAQRLVRTLCDNCKAEYTTDEKESRIITDVLGDMKSNGKEESMHDFVPDINYKIFKAVGCEKCNNTGYNDRIGIFEAIAMSDELEKVITDNPNEADIRKVTAQQKIPTLREDAIIKVLTGITSMDEIGRVVDLYEV